MATINNNFQAVGITRRSAQQLRELQFSIESTPGTNATISARLFFTALAAIPAFNMCYIYIHCVGTKRVLNWTTDAEQEATLEALCNIIDLGTDGLNHNIDVCTEVHVPNAAVFANTQQIRQFCTDFGSNTPSLYYIFNLTRVCNCQANIESMFLSRANIYTSYLSNLRDAGLEPTNSIQPVALLLYFSKGTPREAALIAQLIENTAKVNKLRPLISALSTSSFPLRMETTTTWQYAQYCLTVHEEFLFTGTACGLNFDNISVMSATSLINYASAVLQFCSTKMSQAATQIARIATNDSVNLSTWIHHLALTEELAFETLLYGRKRSKLMSDLFFASVASGSHVLQLGPLHHQASQQSTFVEILSEQYSSDMPLYFHDAIKLMENMMHSNDDVDFCGCARKLADIVIRTLDTEVQIHYAARLYNPESPVACDATFVKLHDAVTFLASSLQSRSRRGHGTFTSPESIAGTVRRLYTLFFLPRTVAGMRFTQLHDWSLRMYVSKSSAITRECPEAMTVAR